MRRGKPVSDVLTPCHLRHPFHEKFHDHGFGGGQRQHGAAVPQYPVGVDPRAIVPDDPRTQGRDPRAQFRAFNRSPHPVLAHPSELGNRDARCYDKETRGAFVP